MRIRNHLIGLLTLLALLTSCSSPSPDYRALLVGQWQEERIFDKNNRDLQTITLSSDGTFVVDGRRKIGDSVSKFTFKGAWWIEGDKYCYKSSFSEPPDILPVGVAYQDKILAVTEGEWVMIEQSTEGRSVAKRVK